jgi:hypothetical protein
MAEWECSKKDRVFLLTFFFIVFELLRVGWLALTDPKWLEWAVEVIRRPI